MATILTSIYFIFLTKESFRKSRENLIIRNYFNFSCQKCRDYVTVTKNFQFNKDEGVKLELILLSVCMLF
jgi:hypothetical protein